MSTDKVGILTCDLVPLTTTRSALVAGSKVFADLLDLPTSISAEKKDEPLALAETEKEIKPFLRVIEGEENVKLDESEWETLARLSDKYDSAVARWAVGKRIWELEATTSLPLHAYTLSTFLGNKDLISRTGLRAMSVCNRDDVRFGASDEWKKRLNEWQMHREHLGFKLFQTALGHVFNPNDFHPNVDGTRTCPGSASRKIKMGFFFAGALKDFKPAFERLDVKKRFRADVDFDCGYCYAKAVKIASSVDVGWSPPPFPF